MVTSAHIQSKNFGTVTYRTSRYLVSLAIVVFIVRGLPITIHSHDVRENSAWSVILVRIEEYTETLEVVCMAKHIARLCALLREPHRKSIAIEVTLSADLELDQNLVA